MPLIRPTKVTDLVEGENGQYVRTESGAPAWTDELIDKGGAVFNVKHPDFGAVGDGTTDDTTAIESAISAAQDAWLLFPKGTYLGTDANRIDFSGIRGVVAYGATFERFHVLVESGPFQWFGGTFDQDEAGLSANSLFRANTGEGYWIKDVRFLHDDNAYAAIELRPSSAQSRPENVFIDGCYFSSGSKSAITLRDSANVFISNCRMVSTSDDTIVLKDYEGKGVENVVISNCTYDGGSNMLAIGNNLSDSGYIRNVTLTNCEGRNLKSILSFRPGKNMSAPASGPAEDIKVSHVHMRNDTVDAERIIDFEPDNACNLRRITVEDVSFYGPLSSSATPAAFIRLTENSGGAGQATISDVIFRDIRMEGTDTSFIYDGVSVDASNMVRCEFHNVKVVGTGRHGFVVLNTGGAVRIVRPEIRSINGASSSGKAIRTNTGQDIVVDEPIYDAAYADIVSKGASGGAVRIHGEGSPGPESALVADVGSTWRRLGGGASTVFYVKESGTGNTGWAAK